MEYVRGITIIVRKAGIASLQSSHSISFITVTIIAPTAMSAGAVTQGHLPKSCASGTKKIASRNSNAVTTEVSPVFPPSDTPAALSI